MMPTSGRKCNPRQQQILDEARAYTREQFERVRADIKSGNSFIFATDGIMFPHDAVRLFVGLLAVHGAGDQVALAQLRIVDRALTITVASFSKALLSRDEFARW